MLIPCASISSSSRHTNRRCCGAWLSLLCAGSGAAAVPVAGRVAGAALSDMRLSRSRVHLSSRVEAVGFAHVNRAQRSSRPQRTHTIRRRRPQGGRTVPVVVAEALGIVVVGVFEHLMCDRLG